MIRIFKTLAIDNKTGKQMVFSEANFNHTMFQLDTLLNNNGDAVEDTRTNYTSGLFEIKTKKGHMFYYDEIREVLLKD